MTHESDPLELELRRIQPMDAPEGLRRRLAAALDGPAAPAAPRRPDAARRGAVHAISHWLAWGVAAAMTLAYFSRGGSPAGHTPDEPPAAGASVGIAPGPASASQFSPVSASNILLGTREEGVVYLDDGRAARKVRYEFLDTVNLQGGDASRATLQVSYPREEIRLVPLQTF